MLSRHVWLVAIISTSSDTGQKGHNGLHVPRTSGRPVKEHSSMTQKGRICIILLNSRSQEL